MILIPQARKLGRYATRDAELVDHVLLKESAPSEFLAHSRYRVHRRMGNRCDADVGGK